MKEADTLSDDLLEGAAAIADFLFGKTTRPTVNKVYHAIENGTIPAFRMTSGKRATFYARKSAILRSIEAKETAAGAPDAPPEQPGA